MQNIRKWFYNEVSRFTNENKYNNEYERDNKHDLIFIFSSINPSSINEILLNKYKKFSFYLSILI